MNKVLCPPLLLLLTLLLGACSTIGHVKPETPREAIAFGYATVNSLADGVRIAKRDELISALRRDELVDELQKALENLVSAEASLRLFESTGSADAQTETQLRLRQAEAILKVVESLLEESAQ